MPLPGQAMRSGHRGAGARIIWSSQVFFHWLAAYHVVYM